MLMEEGEEAIPPGRISAVVQLTIMSRSWAGREAPDDAEC